MRRLYDFIRDKGFYLALGVGVVAFAALIFLYDYKEANDDLTKEQAIDLNVAKNTEEVSGASDAVVKPANEGTDKTGSSENKTSTNVVKDENKDKTNNADKTSINDAVGADGEEIQNIQAPAVNTNADAQPNKNDDIVETASDGAIADKVKDLSYDGTQGLLWPLEGEVVMPYSMETTTYFATLDMYKCNPGLVIAADEGNNVFSAYEGVVETVRETKEYGMQVIVNLGGGYKAIYGQLMNIAVEPGDEVAKASIIGQVAPVSDYFKKEGTNLFFEVTKEDKPVNPLTLID